MTDPLTLTVNGAPRTIASAPETPLLLVLRNELGLTGAKLGCGLEQCGACAVLVDGVAALSCATPAAQFAETEIVTPEGLDDDPIGTAVRAAFIAAGAAQCGYCIPGLVVAVTGLLNNNPHPDRETLQAALRDHLCRCGTQPRVLRAVAALTRGATT